MRGFGGAGAFSDGKFNFTTQFGGWLNEYQSDQEFMDLIEYVDAVNQKFGATEHTYSTHTAEADKIRRKAIGFDLHLLDARCKHLGTERNREILAPRPTTWANGSTCSAGPKCSRTIRTGLTASGWPQAAATWPAGTWSRPRGGPAPNGFPTSAAV
jgi:hypothetical protein